MLLLKIIFITRVIIKVKDADVFCSNWFPVCLWRKYGAKWYKNTEQEWKTCV